MHGRLTLAIGAAALAAAVVCLTPVAAAADATVGGWSGGGEIGAQAITGGGSSGASGGGGGGGTGTCGSGSSDPACLPADQVIATGASSAANAACRAVGVCPSPAVNPIALAQRALGSQPLPLPSIATNPGLEVGSIVNLPTWLWIDPGQWAPVSVSASAGPVTVTTTAVPERVLWDMGDGKQMACDGPGTPYDLSLPAAVQHSDCTYTYLHASSDQPDRHFVVEATVEWHATWQAQGVGGGGDLGTVTRSSSVALPVGEVQAINTPAR